MTAGALIGRDRIATCLAAAGLPEWLEPLTALTEARLSRSSHGDLERWQAALGAVSAAGADASALAAALKALSPWRKGPFDLPGVTIDAEWRSDLKWARIEPAVAPLAGRRVLDVGCGNGYYAFRMRDAGADVVIGVDPTILYVMQFLAVNTLRDDRRILVLPARLHELPSAAHRFDTTFSMGVLYHQRSPIDHLRELRATLRPGGQLVLETLYLPGEEPFASTPPGRYARMKNVWLLPTIPELETWLARTGYRDVVVADRSVTTTDEQRSTDWMTFESLAEALDPDDPARTIEGLPSPRRVVVTATSP